MNCAQACKLIKRAGFTPRSYSGRFMFGAQCVSVNLDSAGDIIRLPVKLGSPNTDAMGLGIVAYWPGIKWEER